MCPYVFHRVENIFADLQHCSSFFLSVVDRWLPVYRNGTRWRNRYSPIKDAFGCFILVVFLPVVLRSGSFKPVGRSSANFKRLPRLRAFSGPVAINGSLFFSSTIGKKSSAMVGDGGVQWVVRDSIPSKMEVCCCAGWEMSSMSIGVGGEYLFIVTPIDLIVGKCSV